MPRSGRNPFTIVRLPGSTGDDAAADAPPVAGDTPRAASGWVVAPLDPGVAAADDDLAGALERAFELLIDAGELARNPGSGPWIVSSSARRS